MILDNEFYIQRLQEELQLADASPSRRIRQIHAKRADEYGRWLYKSGSKTPDVVAQWKLRKQSEVFGDWLADVM